MRVVSTRTMTNDDAKHKNNANVLLSTRTTTNYVPKHKKANEVAKHKNNANEAAKLENDGK